MGCLEIIFNRGRGSCLRAQSPSSAQTTGSEPVKTSEIQSQMEIPEQVFAEASEHSPEPEPNPVNTKESRITQSHNPDLDRPDENEHTSIVSEYSTGSSNPEGLEVVQTRPDRPLNTDNSTPETPSTSAQLHERLQKARIEYPPESHNFFVPNSDKNEIVTERVIKDGIPGNGSNITQEQAQEYAKKVCSRAKNLFAILAYMEKGAEVCAFLDENISDEDLPFERSKHADRKCDFSLQSRHGKKVEVMERWKSLERETFGKEQWLMLAPVFEDKKHYKLHKNIVLPFICNEDEQVHEGGYGAVFFARIHNSHYWASKDQHLDVAIKRLHTKSWQEFKNERDILRKLGSKSSPHPHLVRLLASYEIGGEFFLIFPRAKCNLRNYWETKPDPTFDWDTVFWSLRQMKGIAQALNTVHNFKVTYPLDHKGKDPAPQKGVKLIVTPGEAQYGRHGDIKPENLIFFEQDTDYTDDPRGILQITDFGLGRFHGRDSRTQQWPHNIVGSPTYEPPECKLFRAVSRVYDLWSLGCLYLEFATWLLMGNNDIECFANCRGKQSSIYDSMSDDLFFTIIRDEKNGPLDAEVRKGVKEWVNKLHAHEKCSDFIHQLLDLVMNDLLRIDAADRIQTSFLCVRFQTFYDTAMSNKGYLCAGKPQKPADPNGGAVRALSESAIHLKDDVQKLAVLSKSSKRVSFITSEPEQIREGLKAFQSAMTNTKLAPRKILKNKSATV